MIMNNLKILILFCFISMIFYSCSNSQNNELSTPTSGTETIACDETFKPIIEAEAEVFTSIYNQATLNTIYKNEQESFNLLLNDSTRLLIATRKLTEKEKEMFDSKQIFPKEVLIAYDAIAIIEHPSNNDSMLTMNQLNDIFTGKITTWNQLNNKRNNSKIKIIFDNPRSSTIRYVTEVICKNKPISDNAVSALSSEEVIQKVSNEENSIGIIGVNWISDKDDTTCMNFLKNVRVISITNENTATYSNSFKPYQGYIATGEYPIRRELYCILTEPRNGLCSGFVSFLSSERGQRIILKSGLLPATQTIRLVQVNSY